MYMFDSRKVLRTSEKIIPNKALLSGLQRLVLFYSLLYTLLGNTCS